MKGIIKLYPAKGKIRENCKIRYGKFQHTVDFIEDGMINGIIPVEKSKLLKYFITNKKGIVGELDYIDYDKVEVNQCVQYKTRQVLERMDIGDDVVLDQVNLSTYCELCKSTVNKIHGTIIDIKVIADQREDVQYPIIWHYPKIGSFSHG